LLHPEAEKSGRENPAGESGFAKGFRYVTITPMRVIEAQFESGLLRPTNPLALRSGERVHPIVVRQPDPQRWDMARLAKSPLPEEAVLTEQGLKHWAAGLEQEERQ
jgi:predicted DNA-binding antitoxin AbrB/MazE fold protein